MNVAFCSSDMYSKCTGVAIFSLLVNNKELTELTIYLFTTDMQESNMKKIESLCISFGRKIYFFNISEVLKTGQKELGLEVFKGGLQTYARAMVNIIMPIEVKRVLFVDSDIVFNGSLAELETIDMDRTIAYGVPEIMLMTKNVCHEDEKLLNECKYYINYGVVLFNLDLWRKIDGDSIIRESIKNWGKPFKIAEQSILNYSFRNYTKKLAPKYNYYTILHGVSYKRMQKWYKRKKVFSKKEIEEGRQQPIILHFVGDYFNRPWYKDNICRYKDLYMKYYNESPWGSEKLDNVPSDISKAFRLYYSLLIWMRKNRHDDMYFYFRYIVIEWLRERVPQIENVNRRR